MNVPQNRKHTSIVLTQETVHFGVSFADRTFPYLRYIRK